MARDLEAPSRRSVASSGSLHEDFYLFRVVKRSSFTRRRSSVQSWQQRHRFRLVRRLVRKSGKSSIHQKTTTERSFRYLLDISNTFIESSWISTLLVVSAVFVVTWMIFAGFWAIISIENVEAWNGTTDTCLEGINGFAGYLLFSIETQTTVGYGGRYINEYCIEAIIGLCVQLIIGAAVCGSLICVVFLKMMAPARHRHATVCFSKKAVICQRDGELCLIFRVRDYDMRHECRTKIVAYLAEEKRGELSLRALKLEPIGILIWPVEVIHKIDETSPFWDLSAQDLIVKRFEIILVLEGECMATSYLSRSTTSYLSREIKWGYRFLQCLEWDKEHKQYVVDHRAFNKTVEVATPLCSAQRLAEVFEDVVQHSKVSCSEYSSTIPKTHGSSSEEDDSPPGGPHLDDPDTSSSSAGEDYATFMDLSIEDLTRPRREEEEEVQIRSKPSGSGTGSRTNTLSGTAKDFLATLQKYVTDKKNRTSRKYEETSF